MNYTFTPEERKEIIALMNREIVPAIGCTEPIAVALCVAKATETLGCRPERIEARLSANPTRPTSRPCWISSRPVWTGRAAIPPIPKTPKHG